MQMTGRKKERKKKCRLMPPSGSEKTTSLSQILNIVGTHFIKISIFPF